MIIRNASLWEQTTWAPSRCSRPACASAGRLWCWWARTRWCARPYEGIWKTTQLWRNCCLTSGGTWASCSARRTSLRSGTCCWRKVPAAARAGAVGPCEVTAPAQNTGLGPEEMSFFQASGITTTTSRGSTEMLSDVQLIKTGDQVGASEATLLNPLHIGPFSFGLAVQQALDNGSIYSPEALDIAEEAIPARCRVSAVLPACARRLATRLCICTPSYHQWEQVGRGFDCGAWLHLPTCCKGQASLADPSAFAAAAPAVATAAPAKGEAKKSRSRTWDSVSLTKRQKAANQVSIICETRK